MKYHGWLMGIIRDKPTKIVVRGANKTQGAWQILLVIFVDDGE